MHYHANKQALSEMIITDAKSTFKGGEACKIFLS